MRKIVTLVMAGSLLSGCAGRYMPLYVVSASSETQTPHQRLVATLTNLHDKGVELEQTYRRASREADLGRLPLIGIAVALGLIAVNKPDHAAKTVGKIGIGAGAYAATRSALMPSGGPEALRKGVDAINCVLVEGPVFVGANVEDGVSTLRDATKGTESLAASLAADTTLTVAAKNATQAKAVELAQANAKLAVIRAAEATAAAREQLGAYDHAPAEFERASATILSTLAARTSVRTVIDSAALAASWTKAPQPSSGVAQALAGDTPEALLLRLDGSRAKLDRMTSDLISLTRGFRFAERLKEVVKCPALV